MDETVLRSYMEHRSSLIVVQHTVRTTSKLMAWPYGTTHRSYTNTIASGSSHDVVKHRRVLRLQSDEQVDSALLVFTMRPTTVR